MFNNPIQMFLNHEGDTSYLADHKRNTLYTPNILNTQHQSSATEH